jgi:hypothetical protein
MRGGSIFLHKMSLLPLPHLFAGVEGCSSTYVCGDAVDIKQPGNERVKT